MLGLRVTGFSVIWASTPNRSRIFSGTNISSGVPASTIFPSFIRRIRSHQQAARFRSWIEENTVRPCRSRISMIWY